MTQTVRSRGWTEVVADGTTKFVIDADAYSVRERDLILDAIDNAHEAFRAEVREAHDRTLRAELAEISRISYDHRAAVKAAFAELRKVHGYAARMRVSDRDGSLPAPCAFIDSDRARYAFLANDGWQREVTNTLQRTLYVSWEVVNADGKYDATLIVETLRKYGLDAKWPGEVGSLADCVEVKPTLVDVAAFRAATAN